MIVIVIVHLFVGSSISSGGTSGRGGFEHVTLLCHLRHLQYHHICDTWNTFDSCNNSYTFNISHLW